MARDRKYRKKRAVDHPKSSQSSQTKFTGDGKKPLHLLATTIPRAGFKFKPGVVILGKLHDDARVKKSLSATAPFTRKNIEPQLALLFTKAVEYIQENDVPAGCYSSRPETLLENLRLHIPWACGEADAPLNVKTFILLFESIRRARMEWLATPEGQRPPIPASELQGSLLKAVDAFLSFAEGRWVDWEPMEMDILTKICLGLQKENNYKLEGPMDYARAFKRYYHLSVRYRKKLYRNGMEWDDIPHQSAEFGIPQNDNTHDIYIDLYLEIIGDGKWGRLRTTIFSDEYKAQLAKAAAKATEGYDDLTSRMQKLTVDGDPMDMDEEDSEDGDLDEEDSDDADLDKEYSDDGVRNEEDMDLDEVKEREEDTDSDDSCWLR